MRTVAALFVRADSIYKTMPDVDAWDIERDARRWPGGCPVVAHPPSVLLHVDHILALAAGGSNHVDNLVTACEPCNAGKGARPLSVAPQSLSEKAAEVAEREAQLLGYQALLEAKRQRLDNETWRVLEVFYPHRPESVPRDEFSSARRFIERMGVHAVLEAAEIAMAAPEVNYRRRFRYFCGVCWNKIREPQK